MKNDFPVVSKSHKENDDTGFVGTVIKCVVCKKKRQTEFNWKRDI